MPREGMRQRRSGRDAGPSGLMRMSIIHGVGSAGSDFQNRDARMGLYQVVRPPSAYRAEEGIGTVTRGLDLLYS